MHQYDRYAEVQKGLFAKYVYWVNTNDPVSVWNAEEACAKYNYRMDQDLYKGMCDLKMQGGATSAATCCVACSKTPKCEAFTFFR